jgi:hypothetical protein
MLIGGRKYKKVFKKKYMNSNNIMLFCNLSNKPISHALSWALAEFSLTEPLLSLSLCENHHCAKPQAHVLYELFINQVRSHFYLSNHNVLILS